MISENVKRILSNSNSFLIKNDFSGWDPFDLQQLSIYKWALSKGSKSIAKENWSFSASLLRKLLFGAEQIFPLTLRRILNTEKQINYKALGLMGSSFILQSRVFNDNLLADPIEQIVKELLKNNFTTYPGRHWGYPFDWQSSVFIPKGTPSGVVTSTVGHFFIDYKDYYKTAIYDEVINQIAYFFLNGLNSSYSQNDEYCFSYTPLDDFKVHNANLMVAEYLIRTGILFDNKEYIKKAVKAVNFSVRRINEDGSIYYGDSNYSKSVDNYHTGFVIRSLHRINQLLPDLLLEDKINSLLAYYVENLFYQNKYPKFFNTSLSPIDIHSISESILTLCLFAEKNKIAGEILENVINNAIEEMYDEKSGTFYYRSYVSQRGAPFFKVKIPYIRWGQAWMNYAFSKYLEGYGNEKYTNDIR